MITRGRQWGLLWKHWVQLREESQVRFDTQVNLRFNALGDAVTRCFFDDAPGFSRLGSVGDDVFDALQTLARTYDEAIALFESIEIPDERIDAAPAAASIGLPGGLLGAVMSGMCDCLRHRLQQIEDVFGIHEQTGAAQNKANITPLRAEQNIIIEAAAADARENLAQMRERFVSGLIADAQGQWDESFDAILQAEFNDLYTHHKETMSACLAALDDLGGRAMLSQAHNQLADALGELESICSVQLRALQQAWQEAAADGTASVRNSAIVPQLTILLQQAYDECEPVLEAFRNALGAPAPTDLRCCTQQRFEEILKPALEAITDAPAGQTEFFDALSDEVHAVFETIKQEYSRGAYNLTRMVSQEVLLAGEIGKIFADMLSKMPYDTDLPESAESGILRGVRETVEIKTDALKEACDVFAAAGKQLINEYLLKETQYAREPIVEAVYQLWLREPPREKDIRTFFADCFTGEIFADARSAAARHADQFSQRMFVHCLRFLKEVILHEVCTFEEIHTHSGSKLLESEFPQAHEAAELLHLASELMEIALKKNNISILRPAAHDAFSAKEHEVLVAESAAGFAKGEIIKAITPGYKFKEQLVLRANVIVAK